MKIMVVGGGGREHAIIKKLKESPAAGQIYALPGNGGIAADAVCVPIAATALDEIVGFAVRESIDFAVVAPDDPLVMGLVDLLSEKGIPCFGPTKAAAAIEGSKSFAKGLMEKYGIPTAACRVFDRYEEALDYVRGVDRYPTVIKADGLALGKGVVIAPDRETAESALRDMMLGGRFGKSGETVVIEEYLEGPEVSVLAFTDGETVVPMVSSMDHKRALDGDKGPNTGGMGTVAPNPFYTDEVAETCMQRIFLPTVRAMKAEGRPFRGCLYFGLMLTKDGPKVIEYNCRFGDPETQVVLPLLESDLLTVMQACASGALTAEQVKFRRGAACCVILASAGYPGSYEKGYEITIPDDLDAVVYHAGSVLKDGRLVTAGGRVLGVTATGDTLGQAVERAYAAVDRVKFQNAFCRRDIGQKALQRKGRS
ncbi:MAG TPA: phosphoribosylamine--glycine ligase [Firmicutes bacterium]|nr:phosphoribosylamine--glycine ligase [Bacillota bacterium]